MKSSDLFLSIRQDLESLDDYRVRTVKSREPGVHRENEEILARLAGYNSRTLEEILRIPKILPDFEIDDKRLKDFRHRIDAYFAIYGPEDSDARKFLKCITTYLAFIARMPLHPPGQALSGGIRIFMKENSWYCTGKKKFICDPLSLCVYCTCRQT
ncbi:MAG: DUF2115 family protein [Methanoregula sp.]|jgi:uncharacterized protein (UPF0305 family)